jgi:hypothetical protein
MKFWLSGRYGGDRFSCQCRKVCRPSALAVGPGGQERTEQEYATLLDKAGLRLTRVVPTESPVSVVEGCVI